jgi:preprotein translocase subunit SecA
MNKQRNVVYSRRNHALFGERLSLDLDSAFYSVSESLVYGYKDGNNYEEFTLNAIKYFAIDASITQEMIDQEDESVLSSKLYNQVMSHYNEKKSTIVKQTQPIIQNIRKEQGHHIENVSVPFTDGKRGINALVNLDKYMETNGRELMHALERNITLALIDDAWKGHLRAMDD